MKQTLLSFLPLLAALIAGGFALLQVRWNNITNARLTALKNFKELISEFISESTLLNLKEGISDVLNSLGKIELKYYQIKLNLLVMSDQYHFMGISQVSLKRIFQIRE